MSIPICKENIRKIKSDTQWVPMPRRGFSYWNGIDAFDPRCIKATSQAFASKCGRFIREVHTRNEKSEEYYYESTMDLLSDTDLVQNFGDADQEYKTFGQLLIAICEELKDNESGKNILSM